MENNTQERSEAEQTLRAATHTLDGVRHRLLEIHRMAAKLADALPDPEEADNVIERGVRDEQMSMARGALNEADDTIFELEQVQGDIVGVLALLIRGREGVSA